MPLPPSTGASGNKGRGLKGDFSPAPSFPHEQGTQPEGVEAEADSPGLTHRTPMLPAAAEAFLSCPLSSG